MSHFFGNRKRKDEEDLDGDVTSKDHVNHTVVDIETIEPGANNRDNGIGETNRALKHRHLQMIGIGGAIGTGLWLGTGYALTTAGPGGLLIGFILLGLAMIGVMESLGEMASMFPGSGSFPHFAGRFVDPALGFCVGINYAYGNAVSFATELSACAVIIQYWPDNGVPLAGWITIFFIPSIVVIYAPVRWYGESEFYCSIMKILAFFVIVVTCLVVDLGGAPTHDRLGFRYWEHPVSIFHI